jgi:tyrosine-protein phosphatase YwqE
MAVHYPNTIESIREAESSLRSAMEAEGVNIKVGVAAEYMMDDSFGDILKKGDLLSFGESFVLFECPFPQPYPGKREYLFEMQLDNYQPVLAHPERYPYWQASPQGLEELHDSGVMFQVNLMSLSGRYGTGIKKLAESLLEKGLVEFLGSDLHTVNSRVDMEKGLSHPLVSGNAEMMLNKSLLIR